MFCTPPPCWGNIFCFSISEQLYLESPWLQVFNSLSISEDLSYARASQAALWSRITCQCRRFGFDPWVRKIPRKRKWQPTPKFLPGKSYGQRSLEGYSPQGRKRVRRDSVTKHKYTWCQPRLRGIKRRDLRFPFLHESLQCRADVPTLLRGFPRAGAAPRGT